MFGFKVVMVRALGFHGSRVWANRPLNQSSAQGPRGPGPYSLKTHKPVMEDSFGSKIVGPRSQNVVGKELSFLLRTFQFIHNPCDKKHEGLHSVPFA